MKENGPTKEDSHTPPTVFISRNSVADLFYLLHMEVRPTNDVCVSICACICPTADMESYSCTTGEIIGR